MSISAKIIADSISPAGVRLTTMELNYHRFIHSEFMTHRMFSRNASSSRAIPVSKMLEQVQQNPALPIHWGRNQPGMKANRELATLGLEHAKAHWVEAATRSAESVSWLNFIGLHKQVTNRLLEPFQYIKVIVTATEWANFFKLRLHDDAQPEIHQLAIRMQEAMNYSYPIELEPGQWHLPYVSFDERSRITREEAIKCSVARCARVSYLNHDNSSPDITKDIALSAKLLEAGHMSPFEHQGTPMSFEHCQQWYYLKGVTHQDVNAEHWSGNFRGFLQYRQTI